MSIALDPFFNLSMDCLCIADYDGYFKKINPAFVELLGYSEDELRSRKICEFIYEEDRERTAIHRDYLINNRPLVNFENRYVCKSGELVWLHWTSIPVPEEKLVYAIARDISFTKGLEKERVSHLSELSQLNNELKRLNYVTSHDLRSPVNNLISMVDLIDSSKIEDGETLEILRFVKLSAEGLKDTLDSFVDTLKEKELHTESVEKVYFAPVFEKVCHSIKSLINKTQAEVAVDFCDLDHIFFNRAYLESIFLNLITNSIKYARPGVQPVITVRARQKENVKTLVYADNGLGFDLDKVGHLIFNLNQSFHSNQDSKGVGLYLVHKHVISLGGNISVDSKVNEGTTFTINFRA
ncbi:PAS domain S-box-containing protein [Flavobacteriaceae bacterium MAR_2009_75]|nr:PAS domain S-box-containing protein [Flavobacteriaceae bacterium MAR_2009_75]